MKETPHGILKTFVDVQTTTTNVGFIGAEQMSRSTNRELLGARGAGIREIRA